MMLAYQELLRRRRWLADRVRRALPLPQPSPPRVAWVPHLPRCGSHGRKRGRKYGRVRRDRRREKARHAVQTAARKTARLAKLARRTAKEPTQCSVPSPS